MSEIYNEKVWNDYAESHLSVVSSVQRQVYSTIASQASGNVIDFGCGTARMAAFLKDNKNVSAYTGIDYSIDMVDKARWLLSQFSHSGWKIVHSRIEDVKPQNYTCGISINSYYSWDNPVSTLTAIYNLLNPMSTFILATPNQKLDMHKLAMDADKELIGHPHYPSFRQHNLSLAGNEKALFVPMHTLIKQVVDIGFKVQACHQNFYLGGLNFLVLEK